MYPNSFEPDKTNQHRSAAKVDSRNAKVPALNICSSLSFRIALLCSYCLNSRRYREGIQINSQYDLSATCCFHAVPNPHYRKRHASAMLSLAFLQDLFGWIYFFSWSATFWPQVLLVLKRRNSGGLSPDFMAINIVGFVSYCIFTFASYSVPAVAVSYQKNIGVSPQVELADVFFAAHGAIMCAVLVALLFIYPPRIPPKLYVSIGCIAVQMAVIIGLVASCFNKLDWFAYLRVAGNVKVVASVIKHFPQAYLNWSRSSTVGWSYTMILLDVVGGSFSMAQQFVRAVRQGNLAPFTANWAKTILAVESLLFDYFFIAQHVLWYTDRSDIDKIKERDDIEHQHEREALM